MENTLLDNAPFNNDYRVSGSKTDDYLNGCKYIRFIIDSKTCLRPISSWILLTNESLQILITISRLTAIDLIELRKLILGVYTELPNSESWKLVDASQSLELENPWNYKEQILIDNLQNDMMNGNFVGVKIGDVNDSAVSSYVDQDENTFAVVLENNNEAFAQTGKLIKLDMRTGNENLYGYQMTLNTPGMQFIGVDSDYLTDEHVAEFNDKITLSYANNEGVPAGVSLGSLLFVAKENLNTAEAFSLSSDITNTESYTGNNLDIKSIGFAKDNGAYALYQNEPNPFLSNTVIGFDLPKATNYTISFYDLTGRNLYAVSGEGQKGHNELNIDVKELSTTGMVIYTLQTEDYTATKHMIVIE